MTKTIKAKKGDIFKVSLSNDKIGFFQYLLLDPALLNSEVIRAFNYRVEQDETFDLKEVLNSGTHFNSHVDIRLGCDLRVWEKVGNIPLENDLDRPLFRAVFGENDKYDGNRIVYKKSDKWQVWRAGNSFESRQNIGRITQEMENIDLGLIINPMGIVYRMEHDEYQRKYYT
ncbi:hypothetical protein [Ulvibacterium sp.]|uniref:hypothetical protein n=1 Tax=Ulvibacterium sp. TaxID=2665914 RepID=UPI003BAC0B9D